jgi:cytidylate kinase
MGTFIKKLQKFDKSIKMKKNGITIAIAGLSGTGKTTVAEEIAKIGKFKLVNSGDIIRQIAKERKVSLEEFAKLAEPDIDYELDKRTIKLAKEGNIVIVGRLAAFAAGDYADWKIFVTVLSV